MAANHETTGQGAGDATGAAIFFPTTMRVIPTIQVGLVRQSAGGGGAVFESSTGKRSAYVSGTIGDSDNFVIGYDADAELKNDITK